MHNVRAWICDWHSYHGRTREPHCESYCVDIPSSYGSDDVADIVHLFSKHTLYAHR